MAEANADLKPEIEAKLGERWATLQKRYERVTQGGLGDGKELQQIGLELSLALRHYLAGGR
jgi:hypothetical protein